MCVIIHKKQKTQITVNDLVMAWDTNPDGAGFTIFTDNGVETRKGFMTFDDFLLALKLYDWNKHEIVFHFRIATHGIISPENCHPFTSPERKFIFYHNGIISGFGSKDLSDTKHFFESVVLKLDSKERNLILNNHAGSWNKFVFIDEVGKVHKFGKFEKWKGLFCSNLNHTYDLAYFRGHAGKVIKGKWNDTPNYDSYDGYNGSTVYDADDLASTNSQTLARIYDKNSYVLENNELGSQELEELSLELNNLYMRYENCPKHELEELSKRIMNIEIVLQDNGYPI